MSEKKLDEKTRKALEEAYNKGEEERWRKRNKNNSLIKERFEKRRCKKTHPTNINKE